jgi:hypothetical protein
MWEVDNFEQNCTNGKQNFIENVVLTTLVVYAINWMNLHSFSNNFFIILLRKLFLALSYDDRFILHPFFASL